MPTFIDEQGTAGAPLDKCASFLLTAVWLETNDEANGCREAIRRMRNRLSLAGEIKFGRTWTRPDIRREFFSATREHNFTFAGVTFDKTWLQEEEIDADYIYRECARHLAGMLHCNYDYAEEMKSIARGRPVRLHEVIVVDCNHDHGFLGAIDDAFRNLRSSRRADVPFIKSVSFDDSERNDLLQLADMVCGAVGARQDHPEWFNMIRHRCLNLMSIP